MVLRLLSDFKAGGIEFAGGGRAYCSTKNDGISERKFRHKSIEKFRLQTSISWLWLGLGLWPG
jgi:hypothetical protein